MKKTLKKVFTIIASLSIIMSGLPLNTSLATEYDSDSNQTTVEESSVPLVTTSEAEGANLALNKPVTDSNHEAGTDFVGQNVVDGDLSTRWATDVSNESETRTLVIDLEEVTEIQAIVIYWERDNVEGFELSVSEDDEEYVTFFEQTEYEGALRQVINSDEPMNARYVKLDVTDYTPGDLNWPNIGIREIEVYADEILSLSDMDDLTVNEETMTLEIPTVGNGILQLVGSNAEPVIDLDGNVHRPLTDQTVKVMLELVQEGTNSEKMEFTVEVQGEYEDAGVNAKPTVIPALQQWYGLEGETVIDANTTLVVDSSFGSFISVFQADLEDMKGLSLEVGQADQNIIEFNHVADGAYGEEGYGIVIDSGNVTVEAETDTGAFYATRTLLQMLKLSETNALADGHIRDYPNYPVRGFMLDVGRKFTDLEYLYEYMRTMSYYKMNDFQVHINDNEIFVGSYDSIQDTIDNAYTGFRLESDMVNDEGMGLTSKDFYYTKDEFRQFVIDAQDFGVEIVPEIDVPGHALSFVRVRPDLYFKGQVIGKPEQDAAAMLDLEHEDTLPYVKEVFDEYLDGENPVFQNSTVHIGTDEYYGDAELYRGFTDEMLRHIRDEQNRTVRLWGSLSNKSGSTPVTSEDVQMHIWNVGWANPQAMLDQGYDLINIDDAQVYLVPRAGYYYDYLNKSYLFNTYEPNRFSGGTVIPESHPRMLGGMYALWNDQTGSDENGINQYDMFDRIFDALPVMAQKQWGSNIDMTYSEFLEAEEAIGTAPRTNPFYEIDTVDEAVLDYDFTVDGKDQSGNNFDVEEVVNADIVAGEGLQLNGEESYVTTGLTNLGPDATFSATVTLDDTDGVQILAETENHGMYDFIHEPYGTLYAVDEDGYVGYSYSHLSYSFDYQLEAGVETTLTFVTRQENTILLVDGEEVPLREESELPYNTLVLPLERIGSATNALRGTITEFNVNKGGIIDPTKVDSSTMIISVNSEEVEASNTAVEGPIELAFDDDPTTIWHSNYNRETPPLPFNIDIELEEVETLDRFTYLPRIGSGDGDANGRIRDYRLEISLDGETYQEIASGTWDTTDATLQTINIDQEDAKFIRFIVEDGANGFGSAAEFGVHRVMEVNKSELADKVEEAIDLDTTGKTEDSIEALETTIATAKAVLANDEATQDEVNTALAELEAAMAGLVDVEDPTDPEGVDVAALTAKIAEAKTADTVGKTEESVKALTEAIEAAEAVLADEDATQDAVDASLIALTEAIEGLVDVADPTDPEEDRLPSTATSVFNWLLIGLLMLGLGAALIGLYYRKRAMN